jgi:hypothetical protein
MHRRNSKKREFIKRTVVYAVMSLAVVTIATGLVLFMMGYRLNLDDRHLQQGALVQFGSTPGRAMVFVDGKSIGVRTPGKSSILPGEHKFEMRRDGYETWSKTVNLNPGTLTWLNYALLVPEELEVEPVYTYNNFYDSLSSKNGREVLVQPNQAEPVFDIFDIRDDDPARNRVTLPEEDYVKLEGSSSQSFKLVAWDDSQRHVLIQHEYNDKRDWIVLDTQEPALSRNISSEFAINLQDVQFAAPSGDVFYVLSNNNIRRVVLSEGTISRPVASNVSEFSMYGHDRLTYVSKNGDKDYVAGVYVEGNNSGSAVRSFAGVDSAPKIVTTEYFNENYVAVVSGNSVEILSGSYPTSEDMTMNTFHVFDLGWSPDNVSFSPAGKYFVASSKDKYYSYNLEYQLDTEFTIEGGIGSINWLNENYLWNNISDSLTIREFDGDNAHTINSVVSKSDTAITQNGRYLYSVDKDVDDGYQLQRVRLILP